MNANAWVGQLSAPVAVILGLFACFLGYRLLKLSLGILGLVAGAGAGWGVALSVAPGNSGIQIACVILGAITGVVLCIWLFYLGIFLLGASAGAIVAAAVFNAAGHQPRPLLVLTVAVVFGLVALMLRKFMIIVSTAFSGSYLVMAGLGHLLGGAQIQSLPWFEPAQPGAPRLMVYVVLGFWLVLGLAGMRFQNQAGGRVQEKDAGQKA